MDMQPSADVFVASTHNLDSRFSTNSGGDMSSMVSRAKYELIGTDEDDQYSPKLNLEIYHKFNDKITDSRELHGNLILTVRKSDYVANQTI